jgi:hypothetical protein
VEEQGEGQRGVGSGGRGAGAARGVKRGSAGQLGSVTWPAKAAGAAQRETKRGGPEVDKGGPSYNSPEVQGLHCKAKLAVKP